MPHLRDAQKALSLEVYHFPLMINFPPLLIVGQALYGLRVIGLIS